MTPTMRLPAALAALLIALLPPALSAQEPPQPDTSAPQQPPGPQEEPELILEREVFTYPGFQRRNPFTALVGDEGGPRFEQVELRGVIQAADPANSVAVVAMRAAIAQQAASAVAQQVQQQQQAGAPADTIYVPDPGMRLRPGQAWGNMRLVQVNGDHVVMDVTEFGLTDRRILTMPILRRGGPR